MKIHLLGISIALTALAGIAHAQPPRRSPTLDCTPPNSAAQCTAFHKEIRRNFSSREIGMLFGARTAYAEYQTSYNKVARRFEAFARAYDEAHLTAFASP